MIVIARNDGPFHVKWDGTKERKGLREGKEYQVISWSYQDHSIQPGHWVVRTEYFMNPKNPEFFIRVINEDGIEADFWNDYFLSSEEIRDIKLKEVLNEKDRSTK
jgi:hypothetical protein